MLKYLNTLRNQKLAIFSTRQMKALLIFYSLKKEDVISGSFFLSWIQVHNLDSLPARVNVTYTMPLDLNMMLDQWMHSPIGWFMCSTAQPQFTGLPE